MFSNTHDQNNPGGGGEELQCFKVFDLDLTAHTGILTTNKYREAFGRANRLGWDNCKSTIREFSKTKE